MSFVLASGTDDLRMTNILGKYGKAVAEELFPNYPFKESPIIPEGTPLDFKPIPLPKAPVDFVGIERLIHTPDANSIHDALMKLMEEPLSLRNSHSKNGMEHMRETYSVHAVLPLFLKAWFKD